jgi:hypothetical protein
VVRGIDNGVLAEIIGSKPPSTFSVCTNGMYKEVTHEEIVAQKKAYKETEKNA